MSDTALPTPSSDPEAEKQAKTRGKASQPANPSAENSCERRRRRRVFISAPVRVRATELTGDGPDEVSTTVDVSRVGILFISSNPNYVRGMDVRVTFPYSSAPSEPHAEQDGWVARVFATADGRCAVGIGLGATGIGEDLVDAAGRKLNDRPGPCPSAGRKSSKPLVVILDSCPSIQESLKNYLADEGYEVIAVNNASDGREVLNLFTPALVIAEIEGNDLPGYALCAHVKGTPRLQNVPVVLTTSSAYPSDYSSAHSLGAVVCMAKPYRKERLGHIVRLLAPLPQARLESLPSRQPDASRKPTSASRSQNRNRNGPGASGFPGWPFRRSK
jgi:CheY-like chemotaxis protein